jgi:O-antigen ligase
VTLVSIVGAVILSAVVVLLVFKLDSLKAEVRQITPVAVLERVTGSQYYHARIAKAIFRDHPVFGVGGWGYPRYLHQYMTADDEKSLQIEGGANVHNDSLQFLAEQGVVGYGLMVACALLLALPLFGQAWRLCRLKAPAEAQGGTAATKGWLSRIPPPLVAVWVGTGATVCHSLGDLPFRAPSILAVWVLSLACVSGWLPVIRDQARKS